MALDNEGLKKEPDLADLKKLITKRTMSLEGFIAYCEADISSKEWNKYNREQLKELYNSAISYEAPKF